MKLSEGRLSHLAHLLMQEATESGLARARNPRLLLNRIKEILAGGATGRDDEIDAMVRRKIASLSRKVVPGSREWDVLYRQYTEEERRRRG